MTCWNCGKELADGQRFCSQCGADQTARPANSIGGEPPRAPEPPHPDWPQSELPRSNWSAPAGGVQNDQSILFKILGIVCAVCYGITAVQSLFNLIRVIFNAVFRGALLYNLAGVIVSILNNLLLLVLGLFICVIALLIALRRRPENADGLFLCFAGGLLGRVLVRIIISLLSIVVYGRFYFDFGGIFLMLLLSVIAAGALFAITIVAGEPMPVLNKSQVDLKASVVSAMDAARQGIGDVSSKASSAAKTASASRAPQGNYSAAPQAPQSGGGYGRLKTDRSLLMYIVLGVITCGIYGLYFIYKLAQDVNTVCEGDGKHTSGLLAFFLLTMVTCGIYSFWWYYSLANRLAANAPRYGLSFQENGTTVLLWMLFGSLVCGIGPFIAWHIIIKNTNALCLAYNQYNNL